MAKKEKPFNNPFGKVKLAPKEPPPKPAPTAPARLPAPPKPAARSAAAFDAPMGEDELWAMAVDGAQPLQDRSAPIRPGPTPIAHAPPQLDPELEAYDALRALVGGQAPFDLSDTDEYLEGGARDLDPRVLRRLKRGEYSVQDHLDLHGQTREEAKEATLAFLAHSRTAGKRCVLLVHGRGLHSKDQLPVLKEALRGWMATARFGQHVLAFATARVSDGGAGALYVLLRKPA